MIIVRWDRLRLLTCACVAAATLFTAGHPAQAQSNSTLEELVSAVVRIKVSINPEGRSVRNLSREREGSGIVIDESGLVLTIGYLMMEAHGVEVLTNAGRTVQATVVGYDPEFGFGLLRATQPLNIKPLPFGKSADVKQQDPVLVAGHGGAGMVAPVHVVSKRRFAGSWEYMIDGALFTTPPYPSWSGAALINREGKLVGVGSLFVTNADGDNSAITPGNMFVPTDPLFTILGDLIANGRASGPAKPWLGVNALEVGGQLVVSRVSPESPAEKSGVRQGDIIVGIGGEVTNTLPKFYHRLWSSGTAGVVVPLDVTQRGETRRIDVRSLDRMEYFKLKSTL